jgi:glucose-6-phosphate 1-dehydrogenase
MTEIVPKSATIPESDYVIIGGTGDLALRKIFPALFWRCVAGQITPDFRLLVAARHVMSKQEFSEMLRPFCAPALVRVVKLLHAPLIAPD